MKLYYLLRYLLIILLLLAGCGSNSKNNSGPFPDYGLKEGDVIRIEVLDPDGNSNWSGTTLATGSSDTDDASDTSDANESQEYKTTILEEGTTLQLSVVTYDIMGNIDTTTEVTWVSSNPEVATVGNTGKVTSISPGEAEITAKLFSTVTEEVISDKLYATVLPSPVEDKEWLKAGTSLPQPMWDHASAIWNGYLYVSGGNSGCTKDYTECGFTERVYYVPIDPGGSIGNFDSTTPLPRRLKGHSMLAYNDFMYIIGGIEHPEFPEPPYPDPTTFETILNEKVYYARINPDGSIGTWKETEPLPLPSEGVSPDKAGLFAISATVHNGYIYVTGGWSEELKKNVSTVLLGPINKDESTGEYGSIMPWIHNEHSDLPYDLSKHASVAASVNGDSYLYVIGGNSGGIGSQSFHNEIYYAKIGSDGILYETESNIPVWKRATNNLPVQLIDHAATAVGRHIFVLGGRDGDGGFEEKDKYNIYRKVYYFTIDVDGDLRPLQIYPDMLTPLFHHAAVADINTSTGKINIYVTGGASGDTEYPENRGDSIYYLVDKSE